MSICVVIKMLNIFISLQIFQMISWLGVHAHERKSDKKLNRRNFEKKNQFNKFHDVRIIFFLNNLHTIIMFYQIRAKKSIRCFISKNISKIKTAVILLSVFLLSFSALITELIQFIINANFIQLASSGLLTIEYKFELPHERS